MTWRSCLASALLLLAALPCAGQWGTPTKTPTRRPTLAPPPTIAPATPTPGGPTLTPTPRVTAAAPSPTWTPLVVGDARYALRLRSCIGAAPNVAFQNPDGTQRGELYALLPDGQRWHMRQDPNGSGCMVRIFDDPPAVPPYRVVVATFLGSVRLRWQDGARFDEQPFLVGQCLGPSTRSISRPPQPSPAALWAQRRKP